MTSVHNVAAYILSKTGPMSAMKLQKLAYYSQAWSLVWDDRPLFKAKIEAWANGPVVPILYQGHRGEFRLTGWSKGDASKMDSLSEETIDAVLKFYGKRSSHWLSELTHSEAPWRDAREGLRPGQRGNREVTPAAMAEYYGSLV